MSVKCQRCSSVARGQKEGMASNSKRASNRSKHVSSDSNNVSYVSNSSHLGSVDLVIEELVNRYNVSHEQVLKLLREKIKASNQVSIPVSIFQNRNLTVFELIIRFLHEVKKLSFQEISVLLDRNLKLVEAKYLNARILPVDFEESDISVPVYIFRDRSLSFLEHITEYLKDVKRIRHSETAGLLNRDTKTIWTLYMRAKEKRLKNVRLDMRKLFQ